ncbi:MAG: hypothetical protein Q9181_008157, partial [Wetmoreana brouardii]
TSPEYRIGEVPSPQKAYRVAIEFLAARSLIQLRGLTLSVASTQDQRGYHQICPLISTFAVVPEDAEIMGFALMDDVEGIQDLFERRLAAPSDRDKWGWTPLMRAALLGASEACRLLLNEGSDPLAVNQFGANSFDLANAGFCFESQDPRFLHWEGGVVIELMQQAESDIMEPSYSSSSHFVEHIVEAQVKEGSFGQPITPDLPYIQRLKELGFTLEFQEDEEHSITALGKWIYTVQSTPVPLPSRIIITTLQTILSLGAEICGPTIDGYHPFHRMFESDKHDRTEEWCHNTSEIAIALLQNGVDPCALTDDGESAFDIAEYGDWSSVLFEALEQAGYDIEEVLHETEWRQWCFDHPGHGFAESTAVDEAQIAPPSREGLVSRRAIRGDRLED